MPKSRQRFLVTHPNTQQVMKTIQKIPNPRNVGLVIQLSTIGPVIEINNTHIRQVVQNSLRVALPIFECPRLRHFGQKWTIGHFWTLQYIILNLDIGLII